MKQTSCHHCGTTDPITSGECRGCGCSLVLGTEPPREEIVRSSAGMGGITERWEYAAAVDRYKETGTVEAHEAMLAAYARLNAAVSEEMPPIDRTERRGAAAADVEMQTGAESAAPRSLQ